MLPLLLTAVLIAPAQAPDKILFDKLLKEGLLVPGGPKVKMPRPYMTASMTEAQKQKVVDRFIDSEGDRFTDRAVGAPHYFNVKDVGGSKQPGHLISVAFIAYGKMADLEKRNLLEQLLGIKDKDKKPLYLTPGELAARGIPLLPKGAIEERYALLDSTLVDKVQLSGVMRNQTWKKKGELTSIAIMDERFVKDKKYPNRYQRIQMTAKDEKSLVGPPMPYSGFGGYAQVTELSEPAGALFIEMHFIYSEPEEWFNGKSILVPKLRLGIKNNIVTMRRSLKIGEKR